MANSSFTGNEIKLHCLIFSTGKEHRHSQSHAQQTGDITRPWVQIGRWMCMTVVFSFCYYYLCFSIIVLKIFVLSWTPPSGYSCHFLTYEFSYISQRLMSVYIQPMLDSQSHYFCLLFSDCCNLNLNYTAWDENTTPKA